MARPRLEKGLVQVYTGDGKGKTTAALGLALRALGHGLRVCFIQFLKGGAYTGELFAAARLYPDLVFRQYGICCPYSSLIRQGEEKCQGCGECFPKKGGNLAAFRELARRALESAEEAVTSGDFDLVVLDEVNNTVSLGLLDVAEVLALLRKKLPHVEVVLTGRGAPEEIVAAADLVTEMRPCKHPLRQGVESRRGIEY